MEKTTNTTAEAMRAARLTLEALHAAQRLHLDAVAAESDQADDAETACEQLAEAYGTLLRMAKGDA